MGERWEMSPSLMHSVMVAPVLTKKFHVDAGCGIGSLSRKVR